MADLYLQAKHRSVALKVADCAAAAAAAIKMFSSSFRLSSSLLGVDLHVADRTCVTRCAVLAFMHAANCSVCMYMYTDCGRQRQASERLTFFYNDHMVVI